MAAVAFRDDLARFPVIGSTRREHIERWMGRPARSGGLGKARGDSS